MIVITQLRSAQPPWAPPPWPGGSGRSWRQSSSSLSRIQFHWWLFLPNYSFEHVFSKKYGKTGPTTGFYSLFKEKFASQKSIFIYFWELRDLSIYFSFGLEATYLIFLQINYTFSKNKVIMGATALIAGVLTVFLPETLGMPFPEKVGI